MDDAGAEEAVVGVRDLLARVRAVRRGEQVLLAQVVLAERLVERGLQLVRARKLVVLRDDPVLLLAERQRLDEPREVRAALEERAALDDEDVDGVDACAARAGRCSTPFSWWWLVRQFVESPRWRFAARGRQAGNTRVRTKAREKFRTSSVAPARAALAHGLSRPRLVLSQYESIRGQGSSVLRPP